MLWIDQTSNIQGTNDRIKRISIDFRDLLRLAHTLGIQRQHDIFLIHIGQCGKSFCFCKSFFCQKLPVSSISIDDHSFGQYLTQSLAGISVLFYDLNLNSHLQQTLCQIE